MKPTVHWPLAFISITVIFEHVGKVPPLVIFFSFEIPARMACKSRSASVRNAASVTLASILPVHPVHVMSLEISADGVPNCRKEVRIAELC
jgi:hypothetical protein